MRTYRNVHVRADGTIEGERSLGTGTWIRFSANPKLLRISEAIDLYPAAFERIWALQDGYGEPGYWPAQGYDWSGIRDSSEEAIDAMFAVAAEFVSDADIRKMLGL